MPTHCPVFGTPLGIEGGQKHTRHSPSLDRLDPTKGYVPGNVFVISNRANIIKNDGTAAEHRMIANYIESKAKPA